MLNRCYNKNSDDYHNYGGRGISVCKRWKANFQNFKDDMGDPPTSKHTLERKNVDGNYTPSNVCWALPIDQANNRRNNRIVSYNGETLTLTQAVEKYGNGLSLQCVHYRLKHGMTLEEALERPVKHGKKL